MSNPFAEQRHKGRSWTLFFWVWVVLVGVAAGYLWSSEGGFSAFANLNLNLGQDPLSPKSKMVITRDGLTLRTTPDQTADRVAGVPFGAVVNLLETRPSGTGDFVKARWEGKEGYLLWKYLAPAYFDPNSIPASFEESLKPWTKDSVARLPGLTPDNIWVMLSEIWDFKRLDGAPEYPLGKKKLKNNAVFYANDDALDKADMFEVVFTNGDQKRTMAVRTVPGTEGEVEVHFTQTDTSSNGKDQTPKDQGKTATTSPQPSPAPGPEVTPKPAASAKPARLAKDVSLMSDSLESSKVVSVLKKGAAVSLDDKKRVAQDTGVIKVASSVVYKGKTYNLAKGLKVSIPVYGSDKSTIAFDQNGDELVIDVDTALVEVGTQVWWKITTSDGVRGWVTNDAISQE